MKDSPNRLLLLSWQTSYPNKPAKLVVWPWPWQMEACSSASCVLLSVTEALSKQCRNSGFCNYEKVNIFGT